MADALLARLFGHASGAAGLGPSEEQPEEHGWGEDEEWDDEECEDEEAALDPGDDCAGAASAEAGGGVIDVDAAGIMDAPPQEVQRRIQIATLWLASRLLQDMSPDMDLMQRSQAADDMGDMEPPATPASGSQVQPHPSRMRGLRLHKQPESGAAVARLWVLLELVHGMLGAGEQATQREVWYRLKTLEVLFRSLHDVSEAVQDAVLLLQVPRSSLGITASSKGLVAGRLTILDQCTGTETYCGIGSGGIAIPGDIPRIMRDWAFQAHGARVVLVVEKDAVFQRLVEFGFFNLVPCIIVTGKGVPDLGTRVFLNRLTVAFPNLPLVGLVDWNPAGACILSIYRHGSTRMQESARWALPSLAWLGARHSQLQQAGTAAYQELTPRDRSMAANLRTTLAGRGCSEWAEELGLMLASGRKAEIEELDKAAGAAAEGGGVFGLASSLGPGGGSSFGGSLSHGSGLGGGSSSGIPGLPGMLLHCLERRDWI